MNLLAFTNPPAPRARRAEAGPRGARGFTLVELLVTLSVMAIVLSLAAPSFTSMLASNRLATQTNDLIGALNLARSEAVRRGQGVTLLSNDINDFSKGWKVFTDKALDQTIDATATDANGTIVRESSAPSGKVATKPVTRSGSAGSFTYTTSTASDRGYLSFDSRGANNAGTVAFYKVCDAGSTSVKGRIVQVNVVGKISLDATNVTCP